MLTILKKSSNLKISIFIILGLNLIYAIGYIGNMFIEGHCSFVADLSIFISLIYILLLPFIGYMIHRFVSKRVAWSVARVHLDDLGAFGLLTDEKLKNTPSLTSKIDEYKKEFKSTIKTMGEYDTISMIIKFNYFIIFTFSTVATICNYKQVNIEAYTIFLTSFFILLSLIIYLLSMRSKKKIKNILKRLGEV